MTNPAGTPATAPCGGQKPVRKLRAELAPASRTTKRLSRSTSGFRFSRCRLASGYNKMRSVYAPAVCACSATTAVRVPAGMQALPELWPQRESWWLFEEIPSLGLVREGKPFLNLERQMRVVGPCGISLDSTRIHTNCISIMFWSHLGQEFYAGLSQTSEILMNCEGCRMRYQACTRI